jgi:hypothetical protein
MRLRIVENREKAWRAASSSLALLLPGSVLTSVYRGGTVDATQAAQGKQMEAQAAAIKEIDTRLRETERRQPPAKSSL